MTEIADITPEWVEAYLIEMVQVSAARPDPERRFLRGLVSGHPAIGADWETHIGHADKPIDPITGLPDTSVPKMRPAHPSSAQIDRAEISVGWIGRHVVVIEHRRILGCTLIVKAQGHTTIWPRVRGMMRVGVRRHSNDTMRRLYQRALNDIAAGIRAELVIAAAQRASRAATRRAMVSDSGNGGKATQRAAMGKRERVG